MFNAPLSEDYEEYIELYNLSATNWVNLSGYRLGDPADQDSLIAHGEDLYLAPKTFALILDAGYWMHSSIYDTLMPSAALVLTIDDYAFGSNGLSSSQPDTILLLDSLSDTLAFFAYTADNPDGYSEEKIRLEGGDDASNWSNGLTDLGTPGFTNSLQPPDLDLAVTELTANPTPLPLNASLTLTAHLENTGLLTIPEVEVTFAASSLQSNFPDSLLGGGSFSNLPPAGTVQVSWSGTLTTPGPHRLFVWHDLTDAHPENDSLSILLLGGYPPASLVITELMVHPAPGLGEWVELYNPATTPVDLIGFSFTDADTADRLVVRDSSRIVSGGQFAVLAQDSSIFDLNPPVESIVLVMDSWRTLNDNGDTPTLLDPTFAIQDAVPYTGWTIPSGVSLERINPLGSSSAPANWQPTLNASGGTPGQANSVQTPPPGSSGGSLSFSFGPFDPDQGEPLRITLILPEGSTTITLSAFDLRGRRLKVIFDQDVPSGYVQTSWNGHDSDGRRLPPGLYLLLAEFRSSSGHRNSTTKKTLVIAGKL